MSLVVLTNVGSTYDAIAGSKGLGMFRANFTGLTQVMLDVFVNKVGTGTQSWQLWNETDGTEIGVIDDAGATGDKFLNAVFSVSLTGEKLVRLRVKSTVAADDPLFYDFAICGR